MAADCLPGEALNPARTQGTDQSQMQASGRDQKVQIIANVIYIWPILPFQLLRQHQQDGGPAGAGAARPDGQRRLAARVRGGDAGRGTPEAGVAAPLRSAVPQPRRHRLPRPRGLLFSKGMILK